MNEKPLTKAVWRTKYKGFPLLFYVKVLVVVCILYLWICVCVCSPLGIPVTGLRDTGWSDSWDACDVLLLLCCPYVRDLRNCCYFFRWNLSMILNVLLQTKEKVSWHARKGENNPKWDKNQNQICPKKRKSQKKQKNTYKQSESW